MGSLRGADVLPRAADQACGGSNCQGLRHSPSTGDHLIEMISLLSGGLRAVHVSHARLEKVFELGIFPRCFVAIIGLLVSPLHGLIVHEKGGGGRQMRALLLPEKKPRPLTHPST